MDITLKHRQKTFPKRNRISLIEVLVKLFKFLVKLFKFLVILIFFSTGTAVTIGSLVIFLVFPNKTSGLPEARRDPVLVNMKPDVLAKGTAVWGIYYTDNKASPRTNVLYGGEKTFKAYNYNRLLNDSATIEKTGIIWQDSIFFVLKDYATIETGIIWQDSMFFVLKKDTCELHYICPWPSFGQWKMGNHLEFSLYQRNTLLKSGYQFQAVGIRGDDNLLEIMCIPSDTVMRNVPSKLIIKDLVD